MKIKEIEIGAFGKFKDYTLTFSHPFQLIYGQNEDGKTTLMTFISMMFYSDQGRSQSLEQNPRRKYTPWSGAPMEGGLVFEWKGEDYHLSKQFGDTPGRDKTTLTNLSLEKEVALNRREEVGMKFFGLDLSGFQRSSFISQLGVIEPGRGTDQIAEKLLSNLVDTGDEDLSGQEAIARLEKAKQDLVRPRAASGRLTLLTNKHDLLLEERQEILNLLEDQDENQEALNYAQSLLKEQRLLENQQKAAQVEAQSQRLQQLLHGAEQLELEKKDLEKSGSSIRELEVLLLRGKSLLAQQDTLSAGLAPLLKTLDNQKSSITKEELLQLEQRVQRQEKAAALLALWDKDVATALEKLEGFQSQSQTLQADLQKTSTQLTHLTPAMEALSSSQEKKTSLLLQEVEIKDRIECDQRVFLQQEELRKEQLQLYIPQLEALRKSAKTFNIPLLLLGILIIAAGAALGYLVVPMMALLSGIGFLPLLLALPPKQASEGTEEQQALEEKIQQVEKDLDSSKAQQDKEHHQRLQQLDAVEKSLALLVDSEKQKPQLNTEFTQLREQESQLNNQIQQLSYHRNTLLDSLSTLDETFSFLHLSQGLSGLTKEELSPISAQLKRNVLTCQQKVEELLAAKSVTSQREFEQQHLAYLSSQDRQKQVTDMNQELQHLNQQLQETVATLHPKSLGEIPGLLSTLEKNLLGYNNDHNQLSATARAMGLVSSSLEYLGKELCKLPKDLQEVPTPQELEEGVVRLEELEQKGLLEEIQLLQKNLKSPSRSLEDLDLELADLRQQLVTMNNYYTSLTLALEAMEQAQTEMRSSFGPLVNEKTSEIFTQLTNQKYDTLRVDQNYQITLKEGVHFRPWGYLSGGTTDQAYLALRLAISHLIAPSEGTLPLLLDDILIQYDDARAKAALEFFLQYSKETDTQILLFSCHNRMKTLVKELRGPRQSID